MRVLLRGWWLLGMLLWTGCTGALPVSGSTAPATIDRPTMARRAPGYPESERRARGERIELPAAQLFVEDGYAVPADGRVPLFVHFQGAVWAAEENFVRFERSGVLIASKLAGRSSAFAAPYRDPSAFAELLAAGEAALAGRCGRRVTFAPVTITFWSAGYGAVREFLACDEHFARIDGLVSADSIYAEVVAPDVRAPRAEQMQGFLRFAQAAARGEKTFVLCHGRFQTDYASTAETAALIAAAVGARPEPVRAFTERGVPIAGELHIGRFHLYEFAESDARIHVDCLYFVPELVRRHMP